MCRIVQHEQLPDGSWKYLVEAEVIDNGIPQITDYNPTKGEVTTIRTVKIGVDRTWNPDRMANYMRRQKSYIYNIVSHEPILGADESLEEAADKQRVRFNGVDYVDMFGLHVYVKSRFTWNKGEAVDIDARFPSKIYPMHLLGDELEWMLEIEYT